MEGDSHKPKFRWFESRRGGVISLVLLTLAVVGLFLPVWSGWLGIFHDDQAMAEFPWHYFLARHFQSGEIPLWEPNTWCGAIPFYARYYADTYYLPLWPFYLLTKLGDLNQAYWMLSLLPLLLHYYLAAAGMYIFARQAIRLRPLPAFVTAWIYLFSPAFSYSYVWFPIVVVQAWLPWLLTLIVASDRRPGWLKVAGGGVILALMSAAAQPPHVGYSLVLGGILAVALAVRRLKRKECKYCWRAPVMLALAVAVGFALSAVFWVSTIDGLPYTAQHIELSYESMTGKDGSLPPLYLATLFVPNLFGTVTGQHMWGSAVSYEARYWEANLSGGLLLTFLALGGVFLVARRRPGCRRLRFWAGLATGVWIFALLCMLGRHTPFYRLFFKVVPVLSKFPFPIRYRLLQCVATAWLAGLGLENLISRDQAKRFWPARRVWCYLGLAILVIAPALLCPQDLTSHLLGRIKPLNTAWVFPGIKEIFIRGEGEWFLNYPVSYFLAAAVFLILVWRGLRGKIRTLAVVGLVMLDTAGFALAGFYFCTFERRVSRPEHFRVTRPKDHPMVKRVLESLALVRTDPDLRWATDQPFHDNFSRLEGSFALMGYDMKPLEKRFKNAIETAYDCPMDWPIYWNYPRAFNVPFLSNMSVGYLMDSNPENPFKGGTTVKLESSPELVVHRNPRALPRVFTMDRIVQASDDEQRDQLVAGDLRRAVFVEKVPQEATGAQVMFYHEFREWTDQTGASFKGNQAVDFDSKSIDHRHFKELQELNKISGIDLTHANSIDVDIDATKPAMLVLTEVWYPGWRAMVDGQPVPVHRVNYCQRGIWLERGTHHVMMMFQPLSWKIGAIISIVSWSLLIAISLVFGVKKGLVPKVRGFVEQ